MSKTPISILQEMMVKKQIVPDYQLIHDGGGTHINTFVYKVTCDGLTANGTGRSKKDAKHQAAKAMLQTIAAHRGYPQLPASPAQSPLRTPLIPTVPEVERLPPNLPFVNAIGVLKEICIENNLQEPEYVLISNTGPPHAKIFTIQCIVATFKEIGVAKTKKQAKQEAAKKMLDKITDLVDFDLSHLEVEEKKAKIEESNANAKHHFKMLTKTFVKKVNLGTKISQYHMMLKNSFTPEVYNDIIQKLEAVIPQDHSNISVEYVENLMSNFKELLSTIELDISIFYLDTISPDDYCVGMKINTTPEITAIANGQTEAQAAFYTILKVINTMILLLK
ncbi:interferon-inducible double-stranded RNA-dependent protein kinase activator A-like [Colletes gigas]|uniref:interferon-inducible double-stranded RNA-dependent protein kinase activator A-like n=1 Tax=Colletes gigas TaxID=935657 RepID=UPI001C9BA6E6|nr:interferon-inducible double-stranded RNA-dependent protein kinase activator A-like [Colletes gigas]